MRSPEFCRSVQLAGDFVMGYDTIRVVEYPSRRSLLSMMNDESWDIALKSDEWEWNTGVPSEPILDASITDIPQPITPSFKDLTGFEQPPSQCSDAIRQAQTRSEILNHACYEKTATTNIGSFGAPCASLFEADATTCPEACQAVVDELRPCLAGMWNTYSANEAMLLRALKNGMIPATAVASRLSPRAWYLEVVRRGCRGPDTSDSSAPTSASCSLSPLHFLVFAISTVMFMMQ